MNLIIPLIESFGISDIGLSRQNNEDVWGELPDDHFYILADGMGGHLAGEIAAKEAVLHLCDSIERYLRNNSAPTVENIKSYLRQAFNNANQWIRSLSTQHPDLSGMGTTLCCLIVLGKHVIYAHLGDSRIYRFRQKLECLTTDHSLREERRANGELYGSVSQHYPHKNLLTRALGISPTVNPTIGQTTLESQDVYFLCSDGLHDPLSDRQIEAILRRSSHIKEAAIDLVEAAKGGGGNDNITVLIIKNTA